MSGADGAGGASHGYGLAGVEADALHWAFRGGYGCAPMGHGEVVDEEMSFVPGWLNGKGRGLKPLVICGFDSHPGHQFFGVLDSVGGACYARFCRRGVGCWRRMF